MLKTKNEERLLLALSYLPEGISEEIRRKATSRRAGISKVREIRIRQGGRSSMLVGDESIRLFSKVDKECMTRTLEALMEGALYAHRDSIASGFISIGQGVRVGVCGRARYDGGRLVGVSDVSSLLFRIPTGECAFADELYSIYLESGGGILIYSPPGVGKTTALRSLAGKIGGGASAKRVCVIDERCEFDGSDYSSLEVDILGGYRRAEGIEIATRTLSPEIIMIDEIGEGDAEGISRVIKCGIPIIATAHASSLEELKSRTPLAPLFAIRAFSTFVGISKEGGEYLLSPECDASAC